MTIDQLYYFKKLAELQHYTKAANELYISQPTLSFSISNLEKELGVTLFQKNGRNVVLTDYGNELYKCVTEVLTKLDNGLAMFKRYVDRNTDKIAISTIPTIPSDFITKNIKTYIETYPQTKFDILTIVDNKDVIDGINDGIYDIGFCFKVEENKNLCFVPILRQELVAIAKAGHELCKKRKLVLSDLQDYPLITYRENNHLGYFIRKLFKEQKIVPNIAFSSDEVITISEMVAKDFGIAILSYIPILKNYVSIIPLDIESDSPTLYLVYHKNSNRSKSIKNFIRHLIESSSVV